MQYMSKPPVVKTASGVVRTGSCIFQGLLIGTDGVNDPTVTLYNNTAASGDEVVPTATYDASALGLNGLTGVNVWCDKGLYVEIACSGDVVVVIFYSPLKQPY